MTVKEFRKKVMELHPDLNGGDTSRVGELIALMEEQKKDLLLNRTCLCGCGRKLTKHHAYKYLYGRKRGSQHNNGMFFNSQHGRLYASYRKHLKKLTLASEQTNSQNPVS